MNLWERYKYLWMVLIGWAVFLTFVSIHTAVTFWLGSASGLVLALAAVVFSAARLGRSTKDVMVHGIAWTLAVSLGLLGALSMYAVFSS